jgi:hypothetical protein
MKIFTFKYGRGKKGVVIAPTKGIAGNKIRDTLEKVGREQSFSGLTEIEPNYSACYL